MNINVHAIVQGLHKLAPLTKTFPEVLLSSQKEPFKDF